MIEGAERVSVTGSAKKEPCTPLITELEKYEKTVAGSPQEKFAENTGIKIPQRIKPIPLSVVQCLLQITER
jgi:hypothetical protein